jgi:hypothetical protein
MNLKDFLYSLACLSFSIVIGAAVYEHLGVVPQWAAAPPYSLSMFQGEFALKAQAFWIPVHPVTLVLVISTLALFWKTERRKNILITLIGYVTILAITAVYFVPTLIEITGTPYSSTVDPILTERAQLWETLSIVRLFILVGLAMVMFLGLTKVSDKVKTANI